MNTKSEVRRERARARTRARERRSSNNNKNKNNNGTGFTCVLHTHFSEEEHPCINQRTTNTEHNTVQHNRKVERANERARASSRIPCIYCVCYIRSFSVPRCFYAHTLVRSVFMFCTRAHTQTHQPIRHQPYSHSHTHTHFHAHRERSVFRALALSLSLSTSWSLIHLFSVPLIRFNVPTKKRIHKPASSHPSCMVYR